MRETEKETAMMTHRRGFLQGLGAAFALAALPLRLAAARAAGN